MTQTTAEPTPADPPPVQSQRWAVRFFSIWAGEGLSLLGSSIVQFALVWWFALTTGSATTLAFGTVAGLLPPVLLSPFAGVMVDRWNRRIVLIVSDILTACSTLVLIGLFAAGVTQVWHVYAVLFLRSISSTFYGAAMSSSIALMVPREHLARAAGMNQTMTAVVNIGSSPLAAFLIAVLPMTTVLAIDVITVILAIIPLVIFSIPQPIRSVEAAEKDANGLSSVWQDFLEGLRYVVRWRGLLAFCLFAAGINLLAAPISTLLPLLITENFGGDAMALGTMNSVFGVGMLIGAVTLSIWGGFKRRVLTSLVGIAGIGFGVLALGASPMVGFTMAVGAVGFLGFLLPIANGPIDAVLQSIVAPEIQGRVFTLVSSMAGMAIPLGLFIAAPLADVFSVPMVFMVIGVLFLCLGAAALNTRVLVHLEDGAVETSPAQPPAASAEKA